MKIFYSNNSKSFYHEGIQSNLPQDVVEISKNEYEKLINGQNEGKIIQWGSGLPKLVDYITNLTTQEVKEERKNYINLERDRVFSEGVEWNSVLYDCDEEAKTNVTGVVTSILAGISLPENFVWRSKNNQNIPMVAEDVLALGSVIMNYRNSVLQRSWALKDLIDNKTTKSQINKINWDTEI